MPLTKRPAIHVSIEATFASDIQEAVGRRTLDRLLESWRTQVEFSHKRNKITITHGKPKGETVH